MAVSLSQINAVVTKTLNWLRDRMVPTGTIICGLYTAPPAGYLAFKRTDRILKTQYPALCTILFKINGFKGDGSTYANIPDVDHRVIEMCSNVSEVGQLMEAALPNITGNVPVASDYPCVCHGSFVQQTISNGYHNPIDTYTSSTNKGIGFDAKKSNAIYSKTSLQVSSVRALSAIKI